MLATSQPRAASSANHDLLGLLGIEDKTRKHGGCHVGVWLVASERFLEKTLKPRPR
jgi:hypothetical protein